MSVKLLTYTGLLEHAYYRSKDIDSREILTLMQKAQSIPLVWRPFKYLIHVIDYSQRRHVGISGPIKPWLGYHPNDFMDGGLDFVIDKFQEDDFKIYNEKIFPLIIKNLKGSSEPGVKDLIFSFNYRARKLDGSWVKVMQQGSYIIDPVTQLPLFSLGMIMDISLIKMNNNIVFTIDKGHGGPQFQNIITEYYYPDPEESRFTKREKEIIKWLASGLSSKQVASKLFVSESTVIIHRKNMLRKTNCKNIAELISYSIQLGII